MTEYWKSIPKKYCEFCKVWYQDNKASVEFHERGFRHQANVKKKLNELRKQGSQKMVEQRLYNTELMKIEAAAMKSFQKDVSSNPKLAAELQRTSSVLNKLPDINRPSSSSAAGSRYGDATNDYEESLTLVRGREKALDTIAKSLERKSKWLEAKTAEGQTYYWNKDTYETRSEPPKTGFLSLEDQKSMNITNAPGNMASNTANPSFKIEPYGKWQVVDNRPQTEKMIDLQLPNQDLLSLAVDQHEVKEQPKERHEFKEKTVTTLKTGAAENTGFKKRKIGQDTKRNLRQRTEDD